MGHAVGLVHTPQNVARLPPMPPAHLSFRLRIVPMPMRPWMACRRSPSRQATCRRAVASRLRPPIAHPGALPPPSIPRSLLPAMQPILSTGCPCTAVLSQPALVEERHFGLMRRSSVGHFRSCMKKVDL